MSHNEQRDVLDRMAKSLSCLVPNTTSLSPKDYCNLLMKNKGNDFFQLSENLFGKPVSSFMSSD